MFLDSSAGPSSWCTKLASPLDATNLFPTGYNTTHATITTTSVIPIVENILCCPNVISDFAAEDHMNRVDWILDSGASLHFTGGINDFIEYTPLEKNITANTATSADTQIIGKGTVMMAVEGSEHMVRIAPVFYVPDLSMRLLSLGVFLRGGLQLNGNTERISLLQDGQEFLTFLPRWDGATIFIIRTYLGAKPSIRHWGQGPKYPPGTCWIHWEYRQQVTPMCPVGVGWVHFKCPLPWDSNLPRPEHAGYV